MGATQKVDGFNQRVSLSPSPRPSPSGRGSYKKRALSLRICSAAAPAFCPATEPLAAAKFQRIQIANRRSTVLPLPEGEGRGEGERNTRTSSRAHLLICGLIKLLPLLAFLGWHTRAQAHQLDEYLQATLVAIAPGEIRLQINLTPGVAVAEQVLGLIDQNRDGVISTNETAAYVALIKRDLIVQLDRNAVELNLASSYFPGPEELRTGCGIIQMEFSVKPRELSAGAHKLTLANRHQPVASAYLMNAAKPGSAAIQITGQKRNANQSQGEIAFDFQPPRSPAAGLGLPIAAMLLLLCARIRHASRTR